MLSCPIRAFFKLSFCSFNHCVHLNEKGAPKCVCVCLLFPEVSLFSGYSLKFNSVGSHKCICVYLHSFPLFVHHPFSSGCLIVSACSLATLMAARLIVYFAKTAKMLLFLYSVVSVFFFALLLPKSCLSSPTLLPSAQPHRVLQNVNPQ